MEVITKEVALQHSLRSVQFTRIARKSESRYFVKVEDSNGQKYAFDMKQEGQEWRVINAPKVADFILLQEGRLSALLKQRNKQ